MTTAITGIGNSGFTTTLPEGESAASILADLLPAGAHFVKAFGTLAGGRLLNANEARAVP